MGKFDSEGRWGSGFDKFIHINLLLMLWLRFTLALTCWSAISYIADPCKIQHTVLTDLPGAPYFTPFCLWLQMLPPLSKLIHIKYTFMTLTAETFEPQNFDILRALYSAAHTKHNVMLLQKTSNTNIKPHKHRYAVGLHHMWCLTNVLRHIVTPYHRSVLAFHSGTVHKSDRVWVQWHHRCQENWYCCQDESKQLSRISNHYKLFLKINITFTKMESKLWSLITINKTLSVELSICLKIWTCFPHN